jgi:hypothetical protein
MYVNRTTTEIDTEPCGKRMCLHRNLTVSKYTLTINAIFMTIWFTNMTRFSYWHFIFIYYCLVPAISETCSVWKLRCWAKSRHLVVCLLVCYLMMLSVAKIICQLNEWMNVEHWGNDTDRRKRKQPEKNLSQCHSVHYKFHTHWPGIELDLCSEKPLVNHLSHGMASVTLSEAFTSDFIFTCSEYFSNKTYILKYKNIYNLFVLFIYIISMLKSVILSKVTIK